MVDFGIHLTSIPDREAGQSPRDLLDQHRRWLHEGEGALSSAWVSDHLQSGDRPLLEGWTTLTYLAALAPSYRVGHLVLAQGFRNPALLARMAATLQHLTHGRFVLGLGAGWREEEYAAYDYPFPSAGARIEELGEAIDLIRAMWTSSPATYTGLHYRVTEANSLPLPEPPLRILIGGQGPKLVALAAASSRPAKRSDATYLERLPGLHLHTAGPDPRGRDRPAHADDRARRRRGDPRLRGLPHARALRRPGHPSVQVAAAGSRLTAGAWRDYRPALYRLTI